MSYAPSFSHMPARGLLKYSGLALATLTVLLEILIVLTMSSLRIFAWVGVVFGFIMVVLWSFRLSQDDKVQYEEVPPQVPLYPPSAHNNLDIAPPRFFPPQPPEP